MGWGAAEIELAEKVRKRAAALQSAGQISTATFKQLTDDANRIERTGREKESESKTRRFKEGVTKIGQVVVGTVAGALAGGPAGAVSGFVAGAQSAASGGVAPQSLIDTKTPTQTPPIVSPGTVQASGQKAPHPMLILFALVLAAAFVLKKVLR